MKLTLVAAILLGALLGAAAQAQDAQKPAAKPAAEAAPADARPEPGPGQEPDPKIIEGIMNCLAEGLPADWKKTWFVIKQTDRNATGNARQFEANFFYATSESDAKGQRLKPCGAEQVIDGVGSLNAYLPESQKRWSAATFTFYRDGRYQATYDNTPFKPKPAAKPAAKPATKKKAEAAK